ncbi:Uncharacterised protein [Corynebacterium renale]|uniref:hypothetical protein n=1 Tax=Corynebacterium renale TaxID=1724 RepID=UPI000DA29038|nr:hypothetical protein [Corynebacterium renale]SQG63634.1 Uncharacterised protein [Corynebacterium renale]STD01266.1 Uncharacterised protein [Corynebacterium renale]
MKRIYVPLFLVLMCVPFHLFMWIVSPDQNLTVTVWPLSYPLYLWDISFVIALILRYSVIISIPLIFVRATWNRWIAGFAFITLIVAQILPWFVINPYVEDLSVWSKIICPPIIIAAGAHLVYGLRKEKCGSNPG